LPPDRSRAGVDLRGFVRDIPDYPRPGIVFKDITPLLLDPRGLDAAVTRLVRFAEPLEIEFVVAAEARGFILGGAVARELGAGFVPARKPGRLPHDTVSAEYALEYGIDALEVHADALAGGARVLVHDDLLATGGTATALCELVTRLGAEVVACAFLVELSFLGGRARLAPHHVHALIEYDA
jgi:adenine phosphoribosyltransferase